MTAMVRTATIFALAASVAGFPAMVARGNSEEDCREISGVLFIANGTPAVRLRDAKARTTYGILLSDDYKYPEDPMMPDDLKKVLDWNTRIHGVFRICVQSHREGFFPMAYVVDADDTRIEQLR